MTTDTAASATEQSFVIEKEQKTDSVNVEKLYDICFGGASRKLRPIYTLRSNRLPVESLCFVIRQYYSLEGEGEGEEVLRASGETSGKTNEQTQTSSRVIAALRFWNVRIVAGTSSQATRSGEKGLGEKGLGEKGALLFGPLAVATSKQGMGFGKKLIEHAIVEARRLNYGGILISGVGAYYRPFGFSAKCVGSIVMPMPSPGHIVMGLELKPNYLLSTSGAAQRARQWAPA